MSPEGLRPILTELRRGLGRIYGDRLIELVLYGSQARGDAEPGSDIDVLVVLKGPVAWGQEISRTSNFVAELCLKHSVVISRLFMDENEFLHEQGPLLRNIRREGVPA